MFLMTGLFATARCIKVYPGKTNALKQAIQQAASGDTLLVQPGIYPETDILVNKRLVLLGIQYPVIDGQQKGQLIVVTHDSVTISGLQLRNTGRSSMVDMAAIRLQDAGHAVIINNRLLDNTYGIYLQNSHYNIIRANTLKAHSADELNSGNGIHAWKSSHLVIDNNSINGHRDGIYFEFVTDSRIIHNQSEENLRYGLHFMFSHRDIYCYNLFASNGCGVAVMYSKFVEMYRNTFRHNWGDAAYAILLKEISDSKIFRNSFERNTVGIYMEGTSRISVIFNKFTENGWAMRVQANCDNNSFERNNFLGNSFDVATNGNVSFNTFKENYWDKYDGYDLNRDRTGDVPYYPVSLYSVITERIPTAMILYRSLLADIINQAEKVMPSVIPDMLKDDAPVMTRWDIP